MIRVNANGGVLFSKVKKSHCFNCTKTFEELGLEKISTCSNCRRAFYCDKYCQKNNWKEHKKYCKLLASQRELLDEMKADTNTPKLFIDHERKLVNNNFYYFHHLILNTLNVPSLSTNYVSNCVLIETEYINRYFKIKKVDVFMKTEVKEMLFQNEQNSNHKIPENWWSGYYNYPHEHIALGIIILPVNDRWYKRIYIAGFDSNEIVRSTEEQCQRKARHCQLIINR